MNNEEIDKIIDLALKQEQDIPPGISNRLERLIESLDEKEKKKRSIPIKWIGSIAASILLCVGISSIYQINPTQMDTFDNPYEAAQTAEKALILLSSNLNKGIMQTEKPRKEIKRINNIISNKLNNSK